MNELKFAEWLALEGWLCPVQQQTPSVWTRGNEWKTIEELSNIFSKKKTIVVWFSCGAASAVAAKKTIEKYGSTHNVVVVNTPIYNEHPDNQRFLKDVEKWIGQEIVFAKNSKWKSSNIVDVFEKRKYMSGVEGAPCTKVLKKEARYEYEQSHHIDFHVLGFTVEEWQRQKAFNLGERNNTLPVLVSELITKKECFKIIKEAGIALPEIYKLGFPNANCIGCVKATSPTYWNLVRRTFPEVFKERAEQSRRIGCKLVRVKGERIFLDELAEDAVGGKIDAPECSIFCSIEEDASKLFNQQ